MMCSGVEGMMGISTMPRCVMAPQPVQSGTRLLATRRVSTMRADIAKRIEDRARMEGDEVQGQALAILDDVMEEDTRTSCSALVSVCHVIARRNVDRAALRILTFHRPPAEALQSVPHTPVFRR